MIAHRLSSIVHADQIVVLRDGRAVEQGTHRTLMARRGDYFELWRCQFPGSINRSLSYRISSTARSPQSGDGAGYLERPSVYATRNGSG